MTRRVPSQRLYEIELEAYVQQASSRRWRDMAFARLACIPVGGLEVAGRLGVKRRTVAQWKIRGLLPPARWTVSGEDAWDWHLDIEPWARKTGRLPDPLDPKEVTDAQ